MGFDCISQICFYQNFRNLLHVTSTKVALKSQFHAIVLSVLFTVRESMKYKGLKAFCSKNFIPNFIKTQKLRSIATGVGP
jgi:hypothetical protein